MTLEHYFSGNHWANYCAYYEYFEKCFFGEKNEGLKIWNALCKKVHWFWPFEGLVIYSDHPQTLWLDSQRRLHAEGKKAIEYPDGWGFYAYQGVHLPENYGKLKPEEWKSEWILNEKNAELRRVLIQGIGYGKIARDLNAKCLDTWKEYELLKINNADVEPIVMVKMICPSTGLIHAHRVPPQILSAREAIAWCNHGIDKEEFIKET